MEGLSPTNYRDTRTGIEWILSTDFAIDPPVPGSVSLRCYHEEDRTPLVGLGKVRYRTVPDDEFSEYFVKVPYVFTRL